MPVDDDFLSPRDLLQRGSLCVNGDLITDAANFAVQCLQLPCSKEALMDKARLDPAIYNMNSDILDELVSIFSRMWSTSATFCEMIKTLDSSCKQLMEFAAKIQSSLREQPRLNAPFNSHSCPLSAPFALCSNDSRFHFADVVQETLFDDFRELRDHPSSNIESRISTLIGQFTALADKANGTAQRIYLEGVAHDWASEKLDLSNLNERLEDRMQHDFVLKIIDIILKYLGTSSGLGDLESWLERLSDQGSQAVQEVKLFTGSVKAIQADSQALEQFLYEPHSHESDRFMHTEVASLLSRWKDLNTHVDGLRRNHIIPAITAMDRAR